MTTLKTIAATAVIAIVGTTAAFGGLHLGQSSADAAAGSQPVKAKKTYTITLTARQLAQLMHSQDDRDRGTTNRQHVSRQDGTRPASPHDNGTGTSDHSQETSQVSGSHHAETDHSNDWGHDADGSGSQSGGCND